MLIFIPDPIPLSPPPFLSLTHIHTYTHEHTETHSLPICLFLSLSLSFSLSLSLSLSLYLSIYLSLSLSLSLSLYFNYPIFVPPPLLFLFLPLSISTPLYSLPSPDLTNPLLSSFVCLSSSSCSTRGTLFIREPTTTQCQTPSISWLLKRSYSPIRTYSYQVTNRKLFLLVIFNLFVCQILIPSLHPHQKF